MINVCESQKPMKLFYLIGVSLLVCSGCRPTLEVPEPDAGALALGQYVAIGDGYTAGINNIRVNDSLGTTGWYKYAQSYSFPALMAEQFALALDYPFSQPPISESGNGHLFIESMSEPICDFEESKPVILLEEPDPFWMAVTPPAIPDNIALPGLMLSQINEPINRDQNPKWRLLNGQESQSYRGLVAQARPGFFSLFLGLEEILSFAISGGESEIMPSRQQIVTQLEELLESALLVPGSYGVVANLPDPTSFPFFSKINNLFQNVENCEESSLPIYITRKGGTIAQASSTDRILLPAGPLLGTDVIGNGPFGLSSANPVPSKWVMDLDDLGRLRSQVAMVNFVIDSLITDINTKAGIQRVALVDLNRAFTLLTFGVQEDGIVLSTDYLAGGVFSLDGLYLTPRGNAWLANQFITTINEVSSFGAIIPPINITDFPGIRYP